MSFRKKNKKTEGDDVKVSMAKDSQPPQQQPQAQEQQAQQQEQTPDEEQDEEVPDGTTREILDWVGDDPDRAQRALDKENESNRPRSGVTGPLHKILNGGE